jgi:hypothetical protein
VSSAGKGGAPEPRRLASSGTVDNK